MNFNAVTEQTPRVVFACVRNGGRSVIGRVLIEHYAQGRVRAESAGTQPGEHIHPEVAEALQCAAAHGVPDHRTWPRRRSATAEVATSTIDLDTTWGSAPTGLPGPAELLATAFAACLLKNLARTRDLLGFSYDQAEGEVTARRQDSPPRLVEITYRLQVVTEEPSRRIEHAHKNLRKYGTVYNALAAVCDAHGEMLPVSPGSAASAPERGD